MGRSRLYGGIHYRFSNQRGLELGAKVGEWVYKKAANASKATRPKP